MRRIFFAGLVSTVLGGLVPAFSQPQTYAIGLAFTDQMDVDSLPPYMQSKHSSFMGKLRQRVQLLFTELGRFQTFDCRTTFEQNRYTYYSSQSTDFVVHVILRRSHKIFRNKALRYSGGEDSFGYGARAQSGGVPYEVIALPAISARLEVRLMEGRKNKIFWSALRDSTAIVPHSVEIFIYNPSKYPGYTHPALIRAYLPAILRLRAANHSVDRQLDAADRWFLSEPGDDIDTAYGLLEDLAASFYEELDGNLPLAGRIEAVLPEEEGKPRVLLNIGSKHGLMPRLRLDVWRPLPVGQKVGQIEVIEVDSVTAIARLRKLERSLRKRGESLQSGDRVISRKRPSLRRRIPR